MDRKISNINSVFSNITKFIDSNIKHVKVNNISLRLQKIGNPKILNETLVNLLKEEKELTVDIDLKQPVDGYSKLTFGLKDKSSC